MAGGWYVDPHVSSDVTATTCNATTAFVSEVYIDGPAGQLACSECEAVSGGTTGNPAMATVLGPHMYWIVVDGETAGTDGAYELDTTIQ